MGKWKVRKGPSPTAANPHPQGKNTHSKHDVRQTSSHCAMHTVSISISNSGASHGELLATTISAAQLLPRLVRPTCRLRLAAVRGDARSTGNPRHLNHTSMSLKGRFQRMTLRKPGDQDLWNAEMGLGGRRAPALKGAGTRRKPAQPHAGNDVPALHVILIVQCSMFRAQSMRTVIGRGVLQTACTPACQCRWATRGARPGVGTELAVPGFCHHRNPVPDCTTRAST